MNFENIQMAVVRRKVDNVKINISQVNEENRNDEYECIVCGSKVIPVVPNGITVGGEDAKVTPYFKHLNVDKCSSESFVHFWAKTEFIKIGEKFKVITNKENEYICNQIYFEKTYTIGDKKYKPDATIQTSCGDIIHFEFNYTNNKKVKDYIEKWKELNNIIVEVNINAMLSAFSGEIPTFNALYYDGKCFNLNNEDNFYYNKIGRYKITKEDINTLKEKEIEIEKLDWLWDEIRQIKYHNTGYDKIGNLLSNIFTLETRYIAIDILKGTTHNSILNNYMSFVKDKIDRRLKHLNLKYNGYLLKYDTEIPRFIYDRIFNGVMIKFYTLFDNKPIICQTNNYEFNDEILEEKLRNKIDREIRHVSYINDLLLQIEKTLKLNNKLLESKYHYRDNTDFIDIMYLEDYRNKKFIVYRSDYTYDKESEIKDLCNYVFSSYIDNNINFIDLHDIYDVNKIFIFETSDGYNFKRNITTKYLFEKLFQQEIINITFNFSDKSYKYLPRYNFVKCTDELNNLNAKITDFINNYNIFEYTSKIFSEGDVINITNDEINIKLKQLLYPMIYVSEKIKGNNELNLIFNKEFTNREPWLIKDFIEELEVLNLCTINNII